LKLMDFSPSFHRELERRRRSNLCDFGRLCDLFVVMIKKNT